MSGQVLHDAEKLRQAMVSALIERGSLSDSRWIDAFHAIPRHHFVPRFLVTEDRVVREVSCLRDEAQWLRLVYADEPLVMAADDLGAISSSSQPSLMAAMLGSLRCSGGERVLEIGTGSGYNAALMCHGLSDSEVASVDIDADLVSNARSRLAELGYFPDLANGDGEAGYPQAAPFDRLIATCSVGRVPVSWLSQMRAGGLVLVNLYQALGSGALVLLEADARSEASGHFESYRAGFMPSRNISRAQAVSLLPDHEHRASAESRPADIGGALLNDDAFRMLSAFYVDAQQVMLLPEDSPEELWLVGQDGSWACLIEEEGSPPTVRQGGPVSLWDRVEAAHRLWISLGQPDRHAFGLTVSATGQHTIWHEDKRHQLFSL